MRHNGTKKWIKKQKINHTRCGRCDDVCLLAYTHLWNGKHTQERWEGEWFITTADTTASGLRDMENFLGRICKQQNNSETSACWRNKTKQKRQQRWDVALPCLRGMQHSLRHIFVCSTCEMGYLLRAHCGRRSTPLCGHNGGSFQGRGADRPLRPWAARWYSRTKSETKPTHQAERFPQLLHLLCTNIWNRTNRKHEKGGNPFGQAPLLPALSPLVAF